MVNSALSTAVHRWRHRAPIDEEGETARQHGNTPWPIPTRKGSISETRGSTGTVLSILTELCTRSSTGLRGAFPVWHAQFLLRATRHEVKTYARWPTPLAECWSVPPTSVGPLRECGHEINALDGHRWNAGRRASVLLAYVSVLWSMPKHVFWSPDEGGKFIELHCIEWHGGLRYSMPYAARGVDPDFKFYPHFSTPDGDTFPYPVAGSGGTVRFNWPIWFPLLSRFMLRAFGLPGIYVIPLLSGWLLALVSGSIAHYLSPRIAPITILLVGLATPCVFTANVFGNTPSPPCSRWSR